MKKKKIPGECYDLSQNKYCRRKLPAEGMCTSYKTKCLKARIFKKLDNICVTLAN